MAGNAQNLTITVAWSDPDLQELCLSASSASFSGAVCFYAGRQELSEFAAAIQGFPKSAGDKRMYNFSRLGFSNDATASFKLVCKDSTGHLIAEVTMRASAPAFQEFPESATVMLALVPSDIDRFVRDFRAIENHDGQSAVLSGRA